MKHSKLDKQIISLRIMLENLSDSYEITDSNVKATPLTMRMKALFFVSENSACPPSLLIDKLNIAKSNLAILCKGLIEEGLIVSEKDENDKRNIYYNITSKGKKELENYYSLLEERVEKVMSGKEIKAVERKVDELTTLLSKIYTKK